MNVSYIVYKREKLPDGYSDQKAVERKVVYCVGENCSVGTLDFGKHDITLKDLKNSMVSIQERKDSLPERFKKSSLKADDDLVDLLNEFERTGIFLKDEIVASGDKLDEMSQYGMTAWIDNDWSKSYFELLTACNNMDGNLMKDVEIAFCKLYISTIQLNLIYHQGSYYCTLNESVGEQPLLDKAFPNVATKGSGFQIKTYNSHKVYRKLSIWQVLDRSAASDVYKAAAEQRKMKEAKNNGEGKINTGEDLNEDDSDDGEYMDYDEAYLPGKNSQAFHGGYNQTFLILKNNDASDYQRRRALFRYGQWCYGGFINLEEDVQIADIPHVLRTFQKQQGKLAYMCEITSLPPDLPFSEPMNHMACATKFLEDEIINSEVVLSQLNKYHKSKGLPAWIDEETGQQYFELSTAGDAPHYSEVELIASKTYFKEIVLIILLFEGSFYVTLSPSIDDQPLLDMSFPDVSSKSRGFQLATYRNREFKKLMLWQSQRSVWEAANRAVLEERARNAAIANAARGTATSESESRQVEEAKREVHHRSVVSKTRGGDAIEDEDDDVAVAKSAAADTGKAKTTDASLQRQMASLDVDSKAQPKQLTAVKTKSEAKTAANVKAPHHLKPLGGGKGLPKLDSSLDAPWDSKGRPKALFDRKPLGKK